MTSHLERDFTSSPPLARAGDRAAPLRKSIGATVVLWLVFRLYQFALGCAGDGTDVALYHRYAGEMRSGAALTEAFQPEYPPGALLVFLVPSLFEGSAGFDGYNRGFILVTALFDLGACLLVSHRARLRFGGRIPSRSWQKEDSATARGGTAPFVQTPFFHTALYLMMTAALWPVLYARFDIVPAALVLAALHCLDRHRERAASAILGVAAAVKLWPFALLPVWLLWRGGAPRRPWTERLRHASTTFGWLGAGIALTVLPVLPLIGGRVGSSLRYHSARGIEIESTWATVVLLLERAGLTEAKVEDAFGSTQIAGSLPLAVAPFSTPLTLLLAVLPVPFAIAARRRMETAAIDHPQVQSADASRLLETTVLAITLGLMLGSKVLSPQFVLWVTPLLALTVRGTAGFLAAFLTAALTTQVYPHLFAALAGWEPGRDRALAALLVRNALLAGWYVYALSSMAKQGASSHRLRGGERTLQGLVLPLRPSGRHLPSR